MKKKFYLKKIENKMASNPIMTTKASLKIIILHYKYNYFLKIFLLYNHNNQFNFSKVFIHPLLLHHRQ